MDRMETDRFVCDRNLEKFRRLACAANTGAEREILIGLLAEEEDKYLSCRRLKPIHSEA